MRQRHAWLLVAALAAGCGGSGAGSEREQAGSDHSGSEQGEAEGPVAAFEHTSGGPRGGEATPVAEVAPAAPLDPDAPPPEAAPPPAGPQLQQARERFAEGMRAYQANDFGRAVVLLLEVDAAVPSPELAYNIGYCYQRMADAAQAIRFYRRYLETGSVTSSERADVEARIVRMEQLAARQREITMALPPSMDAMTADAARLFASGQEMFRRRRYAPALQAFAAAAAAFQALGVEVPELVYNLAVTSERARSLDDAADYYDEYLRQRPRDPEADRIRAHVRELRQRRR